jgi:ubiquinone/menaquinone biosynthesis C-methylase UbiE
MLFSDHFSEQAEQYAQARPSYPKALIHFVAEAAPGRASAWDCATGSGQAAVALAAHFDQVLATDASAAQIAQAAPHPRVRYSVQPAERVDFPDASVDALTVAQALHWFDLPAFFAEARRVLRPGGLFCGWGYSWSTVTPAIDAVVRERILDVIQGAWAPQNALLWDGYRSITLPFAPVTPPEVSIRLAWSLGQYLAYLETWSATRQTIQRIGRGFLDEAAVAVACVWGPPETVREVCMPVCILAGRAEV